jgi:hypothetical protein
MLAVGRIDTGGNVVPLQLHELTHASKELKQKYPFQFASSPSHVAEWHRLEAERSKAERNLKAAIFHLDQAVPNEPGDLTLGPTYPERVTDIHIAQKCRRLHFLQATSWEVLDGIS